jgi:hypothetical protein
MHPTLSRKHCQARSLKLVAFGRSHPKLFLTLPRIASKTNGPLIPGPASEVPSWTLLTGPGINPGALDSHVPRSEGVTELDRLQVHHANTASVLLAVKDKYTITHPGLSYKCKVVAP